MKGLTRDIKLASRILTRHFVMAAALIGILAIALGGAFAMLGLVEATVIRPIPFPDADKLVVIWGENPKRNPPRDAVSVPDFLDWRANAQSCEHLAAFTYAGYALRGTSEPYHVRAVRTTPNLFNLLQVKPFLGQGFSTSDGREGIERNVVLSYSLWQQQFGADPHLIGRPIALNGEQYIVVGVMPQGFAFPDRDVQLWTQLVFSNTELNSRARRSYNVIGRLKPNISLQAAQSEFQVVSANLARTYPATNEGWTTRLVSARDQLLEDFYPTLWLIGGGIICVLIIACTNISTLMLVRAINRRRQIATQLALGAGRLEIARQMVIECAMIVFLATGLALILANWIIDMGSRAFGDDIPTLSAVTLSASLLTGAAGLSLLVLALISLPATLYCWRIQINQSTLTGTRMDPGSARARNLFVASQLALALFLTITAGLLLRSKFNLQQIEPGFSPIGVYVGHIFLPQTRYVNGPQRTRFFENALQAARSSPEVVAAGAVSVLPLNPLGADFDLPVKVEGKVSAGDHDSMEADYRVTTDGFFEALGIPLLRGRLFTTADTAETGRVMIINNRLAEMVLPGEDPIGRFFTIPIGGKYQVIGVVGDVRYKSLRQVARPEMYVNFRQQPTQNMTLVLRGREAADLHLLLTSVVRQIDTEQPVRELQSMAEVMEDSLRNVRLVTILLGSTAAYAVSLAILGLYGIMWFSIQQRTVEIGVRMALGAAPRDIMLMILRQGAFVITIGTIIGTVLSLILGMAVRHFYFGVQPWNGLTLATSIVAIWVISITAVYLAAQNATQLNPVDALRSY